MIKIEENLPDGKSRISLSMKYCSQSDGTDRDPNGFEAETDDKRRRPKSSGKLMGKGEGVNVCVGVGSCNRYKHTNMFVCIWMFFSFLYQFIHLCNIT